MTTAPVPNPPTTRLAPSPTGALHLGNARTFLITWALARQLGWRIILRIEDLDGPRVKPGAIDLTIELLRWLGMDWDEGPIVQSHDLEPYAAAMRRLAGAGLCYPSEASRSEIESAASAPQEGAHESRFPASLRPANLGPRPFGPRGTGVPPVPTPSTSSSLSVSQTPGAREGEGGEHRRDACATRPGGESPAANWRLLVNPGPVSFTDLFAGPQSHDPAATVGDFILWTKRGQPSYQLAVVVDDHRQGVTHVVRGDDLLDSAARQLLIYRALDLSPEPAYLHLPLVRGPDGKRLAKRHGDTRLDTYRARGVPPERVIGLIAAWSGIGPPPSDRPPTPMSAADFGAALRLDTIPRCDVTFTPEDDRWLLNL